MKITRAILFAVSFCLTLFGCSATNKDPQDGGTPVVKGDVDVYITSADRSMLFQYIPVSFNTKPNMSIANTIMLKPSVRYQKIDGFGAAITGSSCYNLLRMTAANRTKLLTETFDTLNGDGYSYIRISIGCSDFSLDNYTCCDTPGIEHFRIHDLDKRDLIPILKEILAINPKIKIMGSPWTCPRWMKVNNLTDLKAYNSWTGGQLNPLYYQDYANYFVKYIQAMNQEGIPIESITIQNEPLNKGNSASMYMTWQEQSGFIKTALGPAFQAASIKTKIIVFDHNYNYDNISDQIGYPLKIYSDPGAATFIDGAAYHAYGGDKSELLNVHNSVPAKNLYFTEMSIGTWNYSWSGDLMWSMRELGIGTLNNYSRAVIVWNYMLDENGSPYRPGGCSTCFGTIEINSKDYSTLDRKTHYYLIAHLSKAISTGAVRIDAGGFKPDGLYFTCVDNTDSTYGIVLQNDTDTSIKITIDDGKHSFPLALAPRSIASCRWKK